MTTLFEGKVLTDSPGIQGLVQYEYKRNGADMQYRFYYKFNVILNGGYYSNNVRVILMLNDTNVFQKDNKSSSKNWSFDGTTDWFTVSNKTSGTTPFYFTVNDTQSSGSGWVHYTSSTYNLTVAPAYTTINKFTVSQINGIAGINAVKVDWATANTCDYIWYSTNDGLSYTAYGSVNATSGSFNITGLSPGQMYNFRIRVRRSDSQLTTDSSRVTQYTYGYNHFSNYVAYVNNGQTLNATVNNPSGASCNIILATVDGTNVTNRFTRANTTNATFDVNEINSLMQYFPNSPEFTVRLIATTEGTSYTAIQNIKYQIIDSNPDFSRDNCGYSDMNNKTFNLTGDRSKMIAGYSTCKAVVVFDAIPRNYATISRYTANGVVLDKNDIYGKYALLENFNSNKLTIYAIDSREFSTSVEMNVDLIPYISLSRGNFSYQRSDAGVGTSVTFKFEGQSFYGSFGVKDNVLKATYKYKKTTDKEYTNGTTTINVIQSENGKFSFEGELIGGENNWETGSSYNVKITVFDALSSVEFDYLIIEGDPATDYFGNCIAIGGRYDENRGGRVQIKELVDPIDESDAANKKYVDEQQTSVNDSIKALQQADTQNVKLTGEQTIDGQKGFNIIPYLPAITPTHAYHATSKKYVDEMSTYVANVSKIKIFQLRGNQYAPDLTPEGYAPFQIVEVDNTGGNVALSRNGVFIINYYGYVSISFNLWLGTSSAASRPWVRLMNLNTGAALTQFIDDSSSGFVTITCPDFWFFNYGATYFAVYVGSSAGTITMDSGTGSNPSFLTVKLL